MKFLPLRIIKDIAMDTVQEIEAPKERIAGVEYDENGQPIWYTVEDWFDELDRRLIGHYGEKFRATVNETRAEWNKKGDWNFAQL
ncbi:hypothetical protein FACS189430_11080 [Bacteroidia bacterium]|nr:hypothetical protein FACS189430_11080 [Bacteroidia bacterium]